MSEVATIVCPFECSHCRGLMRIPVPTLTQPSPYLGRRPNDILPLVFVCSHCKTLDMKQQGDMGRASAGDMKFLDPSWWVLLPPWLKCEEETCEILLPLFARWNPAIALEVHAAEISTWKWDDLKCPNGHPIWEQNRTLYAE